MNQQTTSFLGESPPLFAYRSTESTLQATYSRTESIFQAAHSTKFLEHGESRHMTQIEYTDEFEFWYLSQDEDVQNSIDSVVSLLEERGPTLLFPYSSGINNSRHPRMRELRIQHKGNPYRILYVFDPRRVVILLLGGNKVGNDRRWYKENVPKADKLYDELLEELQEEGLI